MSSCHSRGFTIDALARQAGMQSSALRRWRSAQPNAKSVARISKAFAILAHIAEDKAQEILFERASLSLTKENYQSFMELAELRLMSPDELIQELIQDFIK
jgi:transcriptional regulator with XRE-family HTH domain